MDEQNEPDEPTSAPPPPSTPELSVVAYWQKFIVKDIIEFLLSLRDGINTTTVNHAWWLLMPHLCHPSQNTAVQPLWKAESAMLATAQSVPDFQDVSLAEVQEAYTAAEQQNPHKVLEQVNQDDEAEAAEQARQDMQQEQHNDDMSLHIISNLLLAVEKLK